MVTSYSKPSFQLTQEISAQQAANQIPLYACVIGPNYGLHRFSESSERALLGSYDAADGSLFNEWPGQAIGSILDVASAAVYIKNAILKYLTLSLTAASQVGLLSNGGNRIRTAGTVLATNAAASRDASLGTRDVAAGDFVRVSNGTLSVDTQVMGLVADSVAAVTGATSAAPGNQATVGVASASVASSTFAANDITVAASATNYNGLAAGVVQGSYRVTAISATAVQVVDLTAGTDNVDSQTISAYGAATALGTRGATFTLSHVAGVLAVGDTFTVNVAQAFTAVSPTAGGTFNGTVADTYILTIIGGNKLTAANTVSYKVSTVGGTDQSWTNGTVPAAGGTFAVGNYGVTASFSGNQSYRTGDSFLIAVTPAGVGSLKTVIVAASLTGMVTGDNLTVSFGLKDDVELDPAYWTASESSILVEGSANFVGTYLGTSRTFAVLGGDLYIDYRELLTAGANSLNAVSGSTSVADVLGPVDKANPLALAVAAAQAGAGGTDVYYIATSGSDLPSYETAFGKIANTETPYGLVVATTDLSIASGLQTHVNAMCAPSKAFFRRAYGCADVAETATVMATDSTGAALAMTVSGGIATCANALFITNGVKAGHLLNINYRPDGKGGVLYDTYTISSVNSETQLALRGAAGVSITGAPIKTVIWKNLTAADMVTAVIAVASSFASRRQVCIFSERPSMLGLAALPLFVEAAYIAGLRSAGAPHQPLTNVSLSGISLASKWNFTDSQLDQMAAAGVWLIVQSEDGTVFTRHQLTTDMSSLDAREDSIGTNFDDICRTVRDVSSPYNGKSNASADMLRFLKADVLNCYNSISSRSYSDLLGPQLTDYAIDSLYIDANAKDTIWMNSSLTGATPLNQTKFKLALT